jgi:hypothetical protein
MLGTARLKLLGAKSVRLDSDHYERSEIPSLFLTTFTVVLMTAATAAEPQSKNRISKSSPIADSDVKRVTGQLTHIEGWHYTIKDSRGEEVSFGVTQATQDPDKVQEGDYIVAMVGEDRIAPFS